MSTEPAPESNPTHPQYARWLLVALVAMFAVIVVRTAWLSEDAYFTFRCVDNWIHGYGARWNVSERVQAYTHPLWFGLLSLLFFITRDMVVTGFALGFLCTAGAVYVLVRRVGATWQGTAMALGCLSASKAFTDYSTSGLENPLSHLLLLGFFAQFWAEEPRDPTAAERRLFGMCLIGGLLVCNRLDLGLLLVPALVYALWPPRLSVRRVLVVGLGFSPLIVWEILSLIYYGFLVPNTAYAKLGSDRARDLVLRQGARYFENSLSWDPITLICIAVVTLACLRYARERPKQACAALGVLLYLGYVLRIGGDYMSGRFFTAPLVVAAGLLANWPELRKPVVRRSVVRRSVVPVGSAMIVTLAFVAPNPTVLSGKDYSEHTLEGKDLVDDERGNRHIFAGLISARETPFLENSGWYKRGKKDRERAEARDEILVVIKGNGGYMGYAAGPKVHYINNYGITDPLLARLPGEFRAAGHIRRRVPPGYVRAAIGKGKIRDPNLHAYWKDLALIVKGPIWSKRRWAAIWRMHTGANQPLLDAYLHDHPQ
jgi:arabinofuranosyltransferase